MTSLTGKTRSASSAVLVIAPATVLALGMVAAVNILIPSLQSSGLHPSVSGTAWIVDSYTLVFACVLIPAGALGDRFGRKRGMLTGLTVFAAGSALAAVAQSVAILMCARALTGIGAALVLPATLAVTLAQIDPSERPKAIALWSSLTGIAGVLGNIGGGIAVQAGGWRALFWAGVPIALASAWLISSRVPDQPPHQDPVDAGGALLLTAGTVALIYGVIEGPQLGWTSWQVLSSAAAALVLLTAFVAVELSRRYPMLDPRLFRRAGVRTGTLGIVALFFALFGLFYVNAQYLQDVKGYTPLLTGIAVLPLGGVMMLVGPRSLRLTARIGARNTIVLGFAFLAGGLASLSFETASTPYALYAVMLAAVSAGLGLAMPPLSAMIVQALPPTHAGAASGLNSTTRELGSAIGVAVLSTILASRFATHLPPALRHLGGAIGQTARHSITAALHYGSSMPDPAARVHLVHEIRVAFTSGTSLGFRVGAALILIVAAVILCQHPDPERATALCD